jgi:G:T-mismatch repair DNA endonuclease (very short patch repair protein)
MGAWKVALTTDEFIARAQAVHGDRYDYSRVVYVTSKTPVEVLCPDHGPFFPKPNNHVTNRSGCPRCSHCPPTSLDTFLARARSIHGDRYDYSRVIYQTVQTPIEIICPEHGPFMQTPMSHTQGRGCQQCGAKQCVRRKNTAWFIERARSVHGDRYDYSQVKYVRTIDPVTIICVTHGAFTQKAADHLAGNGCQACAGIVKIERDTFVQRSNEAHNSKYTYGEFNGLRCKAEITCPVHGVFMQTAREHQAGHGCPDCAAEATTSSFEQEVAAWLSAQGIFFVRNTREPLHGLEIDLFIPDQQIGIECQGAFWHSDNKLPHARIHEHKANIAEQQGIRLIYIWDFDWIKRKSVVIALLSNALLRLTNSAVYARQGSLTAVNWQDAKDFYTQCHIQGPTYTASHHYGLVYQGTLVACMSCGQNGARRVNITPGDWELLRFATACHVPGAASRLFAAFVREHRPQVVWSFSDRQWFSGALYPLLGFKEDGRLHADYRLIHQPPTGLMWHKASWQRKNIPMRLAELGIDESFDPATDLRTERDMQDFAKVYRIMDAGKIRWKWVAPA